MELLYILSIVMETYLKWGYIGDIPTQNVRHFQLLSEVNFIRVLKYGENFVLMQHESANASGIHACFVPLQCIGENGCRPRITWCRSSTNRRQEPVECKSPRLVPSPETLSILSIHCHNPLQVFVVTRTIYYTVSYRWVLTQSLVSSFQSAKRTVDQRRHVEQTVQG